MSRISRRTLLRSGAAAASVPLIGCTAAPSGPSALASAAAVPAAPVGPGAPLRVGLVGCGGRGTGAALQAMNAEPGTVHLVAMGDTFADRVESAHANLASWLAPREADPDTGAEAQPDRSARLQVPEERRFAGFDAAEKVMEAGIDVVLIATPPVFRPRHLEQAIARGLHVFCEKPMAVDAPGVRSVLASARAAEEKRVSLVSGFCWRYSLRHRELFERVHAGQIGDVHTFYSTYNASPLTYVSREAGWSEMEWQIRNWKHIQWLSGDHVTEQACHSLDKQAWAFRDVPPLRVTAVGGRATNAGPDTGNLFDHFSASFEYPDGCRAFHMSRQMANCSYDNNDWVLGTRGKATIENWTPRHVIEGDEPWTYEGPGNDMYQQEHDELFASIRAGEPMNDGEWMATSTMLSIMVRMSAYTGHPVTWEQAMESEERLGPERYAFDVAPTLRPRAVPGVTPFV